MHKEPYYDDEIDLQEIIKTIFKGWKVILLLTIFTGAIAFGISKGQTPLYEASAQVLNNLGTFPFTTITPSTTTTTTTILMSESVRQRAAEILEVSVVTLPLANQMSVNGSPNGLRSITINAYQTDKTLQTIIVQAPSAREAMEIANAWAEASVEILIEKALLMLAYEEQTRTVQVETNRALVDYLKKNNFLHLTWTDLEILTGIGFERNVITMSLRDWSEISSEQRLRIAVLMMAKIDADAAYEYAHNQAIQVQSAMAINPPFVFNYAETPAVPVSPKTLMNTALGIALGLLLGIFSVYFADWWQSNNKY